MNPLPLKHLYASLFLPQPSQLGDSRYLSTPLHPTTLLPHLPVSNHKSLLRSRTVALMPHSQRAEVGAQGRTKARTCGHTVPSKDLYNIHHQSRVLTFPMNSRGASWAGVPVGSHHAGIKPHQSILLQYLSVLSRSIPESEVAARLTTKFMVTRAE